MVSHKLLWISIVYFVWDLVVFVKNNQSFNLSIQGQSKMGKMMISLSDQAEHLVRHEVEKVYHGRVGGLSIFFEQILRDYFQGNGNGKSSKTLRIKNGKS